MKILGFCCCSWWRHALSGETGASLRLRSRVELFRGSDQWKEVHVDYPFDPSKSALIVCDMWDKHWCSGANVRVAALVKKLEPFLKPREAEEW